MSRPRQASRCTSMEQRTAERGEEVGYLRFDSVALQGFEASRYISHPYTLSKR